MSENARAFMLGATRGYEIAHAAATDAANNQMRKAGRKKWSKADYNLACKTLNKLWKS